MPSPICTVNSTATTNGVNVTAGSTVTIRLASSAGVDTWSLQCIGTDDTNDVATVNVGLNINNATKTATFTAPSAGSALIFKSIINNGVSPRKSSDPDYSTTFKVAVLTTEGKRVIALNETTENNATFGWGTIVNDVIRTGVGVASNLNLTSQVQGAVNYYNGSSWVVLAPGTSGQALVTNGSAANPSWQNVASVGQSQVLSNAGGVTPGDAVGTASASGGTGKKAMWTVTPGSLNAVPFAGVSTTTTSASGTATIQSTGIIPASVSGLGVGSESNAVVSPTTGRIIRQAKLLGGEIHVGTVDTQGNVVLGSRKSIGPQPLRVFNVRDYGAKGDGTTDDLPAINAALAAMTVDLTNPDGQGIGNVGQILFFPEGVYRVSNNVNLYRAVHVLGAGGGNTGRNASVLYPDQGKCGFVIHDWGTAPNASPSTASGTVIEKMDIISRRDQTKWAFPTNWAATTTYTAGNTVSPIGTSTRGDGLYDLKAYGFYLECSTNGTSGGTEPTWKVLPTIPFLEASFTEPRDNPGSPLQGGNAANDGTNTRWIQRRTPTGIVALTGFTVRDCYIANFGGFGIWIGAEAHAEVGNYNGTTPFGGVAGLTNANGFTVDNTRVAECVYSFMVIGADANAGVFSSCSAVNGNRGFNDRSAFGCTWLGGQVENCTTMGVYAHGASCSALFLGIYQEGNNGASYLNQSAVYLGGSNSAAFTADSLGTVIAATNGYSSSFMQFGNAPKVSDATHVIQLSDRSGAAIQTWWAATGQTSAGISVFKHRFLNAQSGNCGFWSFSYDAGLTYSGMALGAANNRNGVSMPFFLRGLFVGSQNSDEARMLINSYAGSPSDGFWRPGWKSLNSSAYSDGIAEYICVGGNSSASQCGGGSAVAAWQSGTGYKAGDLVVQSSKLFRAQVEGVSGNSLPGGFATTTVGNTFGSDGGTYPITWECIGVSAAKFVPKPLQGGKLSKALVDGDLTSNAYTLVKPTECFYEQLEITSSTLSAPASIILPNATDITGVVNHTRWVINSANVALTFKAASQTGVTLMPGEETLIRWNGTDWKPVLGKAIETQITGNTTTTIATYPIPATSRVNYLVVTVLADHASGGAGAPDSAFFERKIAVRNDSGTITTVKGDTAIDSQANATGTAWTCVLDVNSTNVRVRFTGDTSKVINLRTIISRVGDL